MTSRVQAISDVQTQISELRKELCAFIAEPGQRVRERRSDEVGIGGFGLISKYGLIVLKEKIIEGKSDDPQIIMDRVNFTPTVIPIKFSSSNYAEEFVREHSGNQQFTHRYDGFWYNIIKTSEERTYFKKYLDPLFKAKRALGSTMNLDGTKVAKK